MHWSCDRDDDADPFRPWSWAMPRIAVETLCWSGRRITADVTVIVPQSPFNAADPAILHVVADLLSPLSWVMPLIVVEYTVPIWSPNCCQRHGDRLTESFRCRRSWVLARRRRSTRHSLMDDAIDRRRISVAELLLTSLQSSHRVISMPPHCAADPGPRKLPNYCRRFAGPQSTFSRPCPARRVAADVVGRSAMCTSSVMKWVRHVLSMHAKQLRSSFDVVAQPSSWSVRNVSTLPVHILFASSSRIKFVYVQKGSTRIHFCWWFLAMYFLAATMSGYRGYKMLYSDVPSEYSDQDRESATR